MKKIILFVCFIFSFLSFPVVSAALTDGAPAIDMLGQYDDNLANPQPLYSKIGAVNNAPNRLGFAYPRSVALDAAHQRLFVADAANGRILVYNLNPDLTPEDYIPDFVLGKPDFVTREGATVTASTLSRTGTQITMYYDAPQDRLFVADYGSNRVLIFDVATIDNGEAAIHVLGQPDFTSSASASVTQTRLYQPRGLAYDPSAQRLFVSDANRVLVFDVATIDNGEAAIHVIGQADYTTTSFTASISTTPNVEGVIYASDKNLLFVADPFANRVLAFDGTALSNGMDASYVLGQANFTATAPVNNATGLAPYDFTLAGDRLFISTNYGVRVFDINTLTNGEAATHILGQTLFTNTVPAFTGDTTLRNPRGLSIDPVSGILYVTDVADNRVLRFEVDTIVDGEAATHVLGQSDTTDLENPLPDFTKRQADNSPNQYGIGPKGVVVDNVGHRLFVADSTNQRVLVYDLDTDNKLLDHIPEYVLGQSTFMTVDLETVNDSTLGQVAGLAYDSDRNWLFVADASRNRIMIFDVATISNGQAAIHVLGQGTFSSSTGGVSASKFTQPGHLAYDRLGQRLFVAVQTRVLVFDVATIVNGENAVHVLGEETFTTNLSSPVAVDALAFTTGIAYDEDRSYLFAGDSNKRILVFDVATITDGEDAIYIIGQDSFTTTTSGSTAARFSNVSSMDYDRARKRLFVTDQLPNKRLLVFDLTTISNGQSAVNVLGRSTFTATGGGTAATQSTFGNPGDVAFASGDIVYVVDTVLFRVMVFDALPVSPEMTLVGGDTTVLLTEGDSDTREIVLSVQPASDVTLTVSASDAGAAIANPQTITFTNANWNTPQAIVIDAPHDDDVQNETATLTIAVDAALSSDEYDAVASIVLNVTVTDDDVAGFQITESGGGTAVTEDGVGDTFEVVLTAQPSTSVVLTVISNNPALAGAQPGVLTFTALNWSTPQIVTVTAPEDPDTLGGTATVTIAVDAALSDDDFDTLPSQDIAVAVTDNDSAAPVFTGGGGGGGGFSAPRTPETPLLTHSPVDALKEENTSDLEEHLASPEPLSETKIFDDITGHWSASFVEKVATECGLNGYTEDTRRLFKPEQSITRAELVKLVLSCTKKSIPRVTEAPFPDVDITVWYAGYVALAKEEGIITGYADGLFYPQQAITREEALKVILLGLYNAEIPLETEHVFADVVPDQWYARYVNFAVKQGIVSGYLDRNGRHLGIFGVQDVMTRAEVAKVIANLLKKA